MNQNTGFTIRGMTTRTRRHKNHRAHKQEQQQTSENVIDSQDNGGYSIEERGFARGSAVDSSNSPINSGLEDTPIQYNKNGKPLIPHGNETYGDIMLNPAKQYHLHKMRLERYQHEKEAWNLKCAHGDTLVPAVTGLYEKKSIIHFRKLIGDQTIKMTDELSSRISKELSFTPEETKDLANVQNTDGLAKLLRKSNRDFSIKVHNPDDHHPEAAPEAKTPSVDEKGANEGHHYPMDQPVSTPDTEKLGTPDDMKQVNSNSHLSVHTNENNEAGRSSTDSERAHLAAGSAIIHLNANVYLEVKKILLEDLEEKFEESVPKRRAFFTVPDPDLSDEIGEESSASWLELFGDVFYVGWLTTFTHHNHIVDGGTLANYVGWFVVMWWSWCSSALYSSRYDSGDVVHHIYKAIELCALVGMAGASNTYSTGDHLGFVIGYIVSKAVLLIQYSVVLCVALITGSRGKLPLACYVFVNLLSIILWGASLAFGSDSQKASRFGLWYVSILIELLVNVAMKKNKQVSVAGSHLAERFGLFTLIILGENLMGFITLVSEATTDDITLICANMMGVIIIFGFFFMCFDDFSANVLLEVNVSQFWMYLHFPLHLCQVALGIALQDVIDIFGQHWDYAEYGCPASAAAESVSEGTPSTNATLVNVSGRALSLFQALTTDTTAPATTAAESSASASEAAGECLNIDFVFKTFLVSAGLVLMLNALIKLINTPVNSKWSKYICGSRAINAIVLFALTQAVHRINSIGLLSLLTGCLLFQSAVDLLD